MSQLVASYQIVVSYFNSDYYQLLVLSFLQVAHRPFLSFEFNFIIQAVAVFIDKLKISD